MVKLILRIHYDNKATINISHNLVHHDRMKYVEVDRHFIKETNWGWYYLHTYVPTTKQAANFLNKLGIFNLYSLAWGEVLAYLLFFYFFLFYCLNRWENKGCFLFFRKLVSIPICQVSRIKMANHCRLFF